MTMDQMLETAVPQCILGVQCKLMDKQAGNKVPAGKDDNKSTCEPLMSLNGSRMKYIFECEGAGLCHMHHVVYYLKQLAQVHLVLPGLMEWSESCTDEEWASCMEGHVVCNVSFQVRDYGTRLHVFIHYVEHLREAAQHHLYDIMGGWVWLPAMVHHSSK